MALTKLSAGTDQYWLLNDIPHQRGQFDVSAKVGAGVVEIYSLNTLKSLARGNFDEFSPDGITPYASTQALIDDLKAFFFRSVAGGGGGGVQSVTGDGVGGTATDPVLTFPTSNEVDNDSLIPGVTTSDALNELGVATSDNATDIGNNTTAIGVNATAIGNNTTNIGNNTTNIGNNTTAIGVNTGAINFVAQALVNHEADTTNPHDTSVSKLTDTTVNLPIDTQVLTYIGGQWINAPAPGFNPVASGVLTNYTDSQNNNNATSNATLPNLTTYLTLIANVDVTSRYRVSVYFISSHDATNSNALIDIKDFGVSVLPQIYNVEPKDNSNVSWEGISATFSPNPLGGGQIQLQLDFGTDDNSDDTTMYFANISLQKINE